MSELHLELDEVNRLSRRSFIVAGSAVALTAKFAARSALAKPTSGRAASRPLSVGYVVGSDRLDSLNQLQWETGESIRTVPPRSRYGDSLTGEVRATVLGLLGPAATDRSIYFDLLTVDPATGRDLPVYLWTRGRGSIQSASSSVAMDLPARKTFKLAITTTSGKGDDDIATASFRGLGLPTRRGIYLLGLTPRAWARAGSFTHGSMTARQASIALSIDSVD